MKTKFCRSLALLALLSTINLQLSTCFAQGTAFTYQGRLNTGGSPATGSYDLAFTLYTTNVTGSIFAGPVTNTAVGVTNGLFTTTVDFGNAYTGTSNWLEIAVSTNAANAFTTLTPRQQLTPVPYAITAANVSGTIPSANISGTISAAQLPALDLTNVNGTLPVHTAYTLSGYQNYNFNTPVLFVSNSATLGTVSPALRVVGYGSTANGVLSVSAQGTGLIAQFGNSANWVASIGTNGLVTASGFSGDGSGLTDLPLSALPSAVVTNNATGINLSGTLSGNGGGLTNLNVSVSDTSENIRIVRGMVRSSDGHIFSGSGFTVTKNGTGDFTINFTLPFNSNDYYPSVTVTPFNNNSIAFPIIANSGNTFIEVNFYNLSGVATDPNTFSFIAAGLK